jgi:hypothetical protein
MYELGALVTDSTHPAYVAVARETGMVILAAAAILQTQMCQCRHTFTYWLNQPTLHATSIPIAILSMSAAKI